MTLSFEKIQEEALRLGWDDVGVTDAQIPEEDITAYQAWVSKHFHGELDYMAKELRCYPSEFFPGAKRAVILISYYKQSPEPFKKDAGLIASYARGRKYHNVHYRRLKKLIRFVEELAGKQNIAKAFSDSAPVLEKALAVQAGLGWFGKNTLLIHRQFGTFTLLSGFLCTLDISAPIKKRFPENPRIPRCGSCQLCIDACPTQAIVEPYKLNATRCLSYHLIESQKQIPDDIRKKNPGYIFGCDICQDVCPHNKRKPLSESLDFSAQSGLGSYVSLDELETWEANPTQLHGFPLQRQGVERLKYIAKTLNISGETHE